MNLARAVPLTADGTETAAVNLPVRPGKPYAIEGVEEFGAELDVPLTLFEVIVLEQGKVEILLAVHAQIGHHARRVAEGEGRRERKGRPIEPAGQRALIEVVTDFVRPLIQDTREGVVDAAQDVQTIL